MSENLSYLSGRTGKGIDQNLFEKMVESAEVNGSPENEELKKLARDFLTGDAITKGAASFYDFLKEENRGKKVYTCSGSVCMMSDTQKKLEKDLLKHVKAEEIGKMCCLGRCHENSAFNFDGQNYSGCTAAELEKIFNDEKVESKDEYHVSCHHQEAILTDVVQDVAQYYEQLKEAVAQGRDKTLEEIKTSNIRGRGGAGFPMGIKLEACKKVAGEQKYIVCNADEGDPGAFSDRYLLEENPHTVLFGMMISGFVVGADTGILYIRAEYPESITTVEKAIAELEALGLHAKDIANSGFKFKFKIIKAAGAYICGEETALLSSIEGQRPEVRVRPPYPVQEGLFNLPTVVNNVETFANVHAILKKGGSSFAKIGTVKSTGTKLLSLDSFFNKPGIVEVEMGTPLKECIENFGGGFKEPVKALHIGGPLGGIVPVSKIPDLMIDYESFSGNGFLLGHASIICIPESYSMAKYLEHLFEFTADESCGKCFPCRLGSVRGQELLSGAIDQGEKIDPELFEDLLETLEIGSLCALGGGLPLGVKNALQYFSDELKPYFREKCLA